MRLLDFQYIWWYPVCHGVGFNSTHLRHEPGALSRFFTQTGPLGSTPKISTKLPHFPRSESRNLKPPFDDVCRMSRPVMSYVNVRVWNSKSDVSHLPMACSIRERLGSVTSTRPKYLHDDHETLPIAREFPCPSELYSYPSLKLSHSHNAGDLRIWCRHDFWRVPNGCICVR